MNIAKAEYCKIQIGPGGRYCACCAYVSKFMKHLEHRKARHNERKFIAQEVDSDNG